MKKIGLVGGGYWGKNLIRVFYELGVLNEIYDVNKTLKEIYQKKYPKLNFTTDFNHILSNPEINGVIISTPAVTHYKLTKESLLAGKDVFVEKPLALKVNEAEELINIAEGKNLILMVGHILHYHPAVQGLKKLINENELGTIQYVYSNRLNIGRIRNEENILWSFAPHDISLLLSIVGQMPEKVVSFGGIYLPHNVEDVTLTYFSFPNGIEAHIFVSWLNPFKEQKFVVIGDKKMAVFDDTKKDEKLIIYSHKINWLEKEIPTIEKAEGEVIKVENKEPLKEEAKQFLKSIEERKEPLTDGKEGLKVLKVLQKAQNSLKSTKR